MFLSSSPAKLRNLFDVFTDALNLTELLSHFFALTKKFGKMIPMSFDWKWFGESVDGHFCCWTANTFEMACLNALEDEVDMKKDVSEAFC